MRRSAGPAQRPTDGRQSCCRKASRARGVEEEREQICYLHIFVLPVTVQLLHVQLFI